MPLNQQLVQAMHASHIAGLADSNTYTEPSSIVLLQVPTQVELTCELLRLRALGIVCCDFYEPYANMGLTAFSTLPLTEDMRHHFEKYELWGRNMQEHNPALSIYLKEEKKAMKKKQSEVALNEKLMKLENSAMSCA